MASAGEESFGSSDQTKMLFLNYDVILNYWMAIIIGSMYECAIVVVLFFCCNC